MVVFTRFSFSYITVLMCPDSSSFSIYRHRVSVMVCLISIECVTSYGKNSNLTSFSESNSVFFRNE